VPPSVHLVADPPRPVEANKTVNFTCHVKGFYPGDVAVTWLENGMEVKVENISRPVETPQGLFELRSLVEVKATEEKNGSVFTCRVVHDAQDPVNKVATLQIGDPAREGLSDRSQPDNGPNLLSSPALWLGILLEKGLLGGLLIFLFKRGKA
ncbi:SIRBL protein, partial [Scopus umbretta]|nr:SIRBL protein [Scopus umbretta]